MLTAHRGPCSEIKIAVIGYVSVGKTTVLNAMFRDRYSHVYMTPTTAAVNNFRISSKQSSQGGKRKADSMDEDDDMVEDITPRTAESTLKEITADNAVLRNADTVQEKTFEIELQQDLCKMRSDTKLVLVDIPGINEAGASHKYRDYVIEKWHTFDCAIVVLDGTLGVNTEEQMDLLKLVKDNTTKIKDMPVIFLCNKVDEPEYEEPQVLVQAARQAVEKIFQVGCREEALETVLKKFADDDSHHHASGNLFPVFIPISALRAFIYQAASGMSRDRFHTMDKDHILKLGKENVAGSKWRKLSDKEKLDKAFEVVSDPEQCREGIKTSNFDKFLQVLAYSVGGEKTQLSIMEKQIDVATARLSPKVCLARELQIIIERSNVLGKPTNHLKLTFWRLYNSCETKALKEFKGPKDVALLANPMNQLTAYHDLAKTIGWDEEATIVERMKRLIHRQVGIILQAESEWSLDAFQQAVAAAVNASGAAPGNLTWTSLSINGWNNVFGSMLLSTDDRVSNEHFGREKLLLQECHYRSQKTRADLLTQSVCLQCWRNNLQHHGQNAFCQHCKMSFYKDEKSKTNCGYCQGNRTYNSNLPRLDEKGCCNRCNQTLTMQHMPGNLRTCLQMHYRNDRLEPVHPEAYACLVGIDIPEGGPSDPNHFGHLIWKFCRFLESSS